MSYFFEVLETSTHAMWNIVVILSYIFTIAHGIYGWLNYYVSD